MEESVTKAVSNKPGRVPAWERPAPSWVPHFSLWWRPAWLQGSYPGGSHAGNCDRRSWTPGSRARLVLFSFWPRAGRSGFVCAFCPTGQGHTSTRRAAAAFGGLGPLPLCAKSHVRFSPRRHFRPSAAVRRLATCRLRRTVLVGVPRIRPGL